MSILTQFHVDQHCRRAEQTLGISGMLIAELWRATDTAQRQTIEAQAQRIKELVAFYDKHVGTPCEQIRHKQQVDTLMERIAELEDTLERQKEAS